jgi:hypothetical protein
MANNRNFNKLVSKTVKFFGSVTPKELIERGVGEDGVPFVRKVDHVRFKNDRTLRYHPTRGWKLVQRYQPHYLLNNLLINNGFGNLYRD